MADPTLLAALQCHGFDKWRADYPAASIDLSGADLRGIYLGMLPLTGANLEGAVVDGLQGNVSGANLRGLQTGDESGIYFSGCNFTGADLSKANLEKATFVECNLDNALLEGINLRETLFQECTFRGAHVEPHWNLLPPSDPTHGTVLHGGFADLSKARFYDCNFSRCQLQGANMSETEIYKCDFSEANLNRASLNSSHLWESKFDRASLVGATLVSTKTSISSFVGAAITDANLTHADFGAEHILHGKNAIVTAAGIKAGFTEHLYRSSNCSETDFSRSNLQFANFVRTQLSRAKFVDCLVFGASVWGAETKGSTQRNLRVSALDEASIFVDNLGMAQFIHLMTHEKSLRDVLDTITSKVVLLLGRFGVGGHERLSSIATELRARGLCPVIFDWDPPPNRDIEEVVGLLASLSAFVVIDLTNPQSSPLELALMTRLKSVPVLPLIRAGESPFSMFESVRRTRPFILAPFVFETDESLVQAVRDNLIDRCLQARIDLAPPVA